MATYKAQLVVEKVGTEYIVHSSLQAAAKAGCGGKTVVGIYGLIETETILEVPTPLSVPTS